MKLKITSSVNAGVSLQFESATIWIDALHDTKVPGYSTLNRERLLQMEQNDAFRDPDAIIFTHSHDDHFSRSLAEKAMKKWPDAQVFIPEDVLPGAELLSGNIIERTAGGVKMTFAKLTHMGDHYVNVPHYAVILEEDGHTVLFAADTALGSRELSELCRGRKIDTALMPFPWVTLRMGRKYVEEMIRPDHLVLMHLPLEGEDTEGYRRATQKCAADWKGCADVRILDRFLQQETII